VTVVRGRAAHVDGRVVAVVVYRQRLHISNLQSPFLPMRRRDGYNLAHWSTGELRFSAAHTAHRGHGRGNRL